MASDQGFIEHVDEHPAYPGGKPWFCIDEDLEDRALLRRLFAVTAAEVPLPKPKKPKLKKPKSASKGAWLADSCGG